MNVYGTCYVGFLYRGWDVSLGTHGWRRSRYRERHSFQEVRTWEFGPLMATRRVPA